MPMTPTRRRRIERHPRVGLVPPRGQFAGALSGAGEGVSGTGVTAGGAGSTGGVTGVAGGGVTAAGGVSGSAGGTGVRGGGVTRCWSIGGSTGGRLSSAGAGGVMGSAGGTGRAWLRAAGGVIAGAGAASFTAAFGTTGSGAAGAGVAGIGSVAGGAVGPSLAGSLGPAAVGSLLTTAAGSDVAATIARSAWPEVASWLMVNTTAAAAAPISTTGQPFQRRESASHLEERQPDIVEPGSLRLLACGAGGVTGISGSTRVGFAMRASKAGSWRGVKVLSMAPSLGAWQLGLHRRGRRSPVGPVLQAVCVAVSPASRCNGQGGKAAVHRLRPAGRLRRSSGAGRADAGAPGPPGPGCRPRWHAWGWRARRRHRPHPRRSRPSAPRPAPAPAPRR